MKTSPLLRSKTGLVFAFLLHGAISSFAQIVTNSFNFVASVSIPDNDLVGVADNRSVSSPIVSLTEIFVTLDISGGYNGDLYAYLKHDSGFSVLLNRTGKSVSDAFGASDSGFNITFDGNAQNGDIHTYSMSLDPKGGILTGTWQPDARNSHPNNVLSTDTRTADFSSFVGVNPNGNWTLFVADVSPVGESHLNSWGMQQIGVVPEPSTYGLFSLGLGFLAFKLRTRKS